jgi:TRAP-type C4-dicarboxylate transport system substrate-binding protein
MNIRLVVIALAAVALVAVGFGAAAVLVPKQYSLTLSTSLEPTEPHYQGLQAFASGVGSASGGRIQVQIVPMASGDDPFGQARAGAAAAMLIDGSRLADFVGEFGVLDAPYLARGYDGIRRVVTSAPFEGWVKALHDSAALQVLSFNWWQGERHLWTKQPVAIPADLAGSRMRTANGPVWAETVSALGAVPVTMPFGAVRDALQQGTLDSVEAQLNAGSDAGLAEVTGYLTKTGHINRVFGLVVSAAWFDGLPTDLQTIVREQALKAGDVGSEALAGSLTQIEADLAAAGLNIDEIDVAPFVAATDKVYDALGYGALRDELRGLAAAQ